MLSINEKLRLSHLTESYIDEKAKRKYKKIYKPNIQTSCELNIRCDYK